MIPRYQPKNPLFAAVDNYLQQPLKDGENALADFHDLLFRQTGALFADLYALTMAQSLWKLGLHEKEVTMQMHIRNNPFGGAYTASAGQELLVKFLRNWHFARRHTDALARLQNPRGGGKLFEKGFLKYLAEAELDITVEALKEGSLFFPYEALVTVTGPAWQAEMVEGAKLQLMNSHSLFLTAASHVMSAVGDDSAIEGGLRRAQDFMGLGPTRAAMISGFKSSSNVASYAIYGTAAGGTMAHFYVMLHKGEGEAFSNWIKTSPDNSIFLPDTEGDPLRGVARIIQACKDAGITPLGIRHDSGDLAYLAKETRKMLDAAGFHSTLVIASNDLSPETILAIKGELIRYEKDEGISNAMNGWLVGTWLTTAKDNPALGGVYKLMSVYEDSQTARDIIKIGADENHVKTTIPGLTRAVRMVDTDSIGVDRYVGNVIVPSSFDMRQKVLAQDLVSVDKDSPLNTPKVFQAGTRIRSNYVTLFDRGQQVYELPSLAEISQHHATEMALLEPAYKRWHNPRTFKVGIEQSLFNKRQQMIARRGG